MVRRGLRRRAVRLYRLRISEYVSQEASACGAGVIGFAICASNRPDRAGERSVVYRNVKKEYLYYREADEFLDGRFVPLDAEATK